MIRDYFRRLYRRTMREAYARATDEIVACVRPGAAILDCGANNGYMFDILSGRGPLSVSQYHGLEWDAESARAARSRGLDVVQADLNQGIPYESGRFGCVFGLSLLEHLLNGCRFIRECYRVLQPGGKLVLLTPNIATYFSAALILAGKMPSTGPHPDSDALLAREEVFRVRSDELGHDAERDMPVHRHLVVFSYRVLRDYLAMAGFAEVRGYGFGLYPFPNVLQPLLERIDPYHCHQMVFVATKRAAR